MKKKLAAVLLTLCMVLGMLPMTAFAAWQTSDGTTATISSDKKTVTISGKQYYISGTPVEEVGATLKYYEKSDFSGTPGTLTWKADVTVTITFNANKPAGATGDVKSNGATFTSATATKESGKALGTYPTLTLEGYKFVGWATTAAATAANVTTSSTFTADTTLYAVWQKVVKAEVTTKVEDKKTESGKTVTVAKSEVKFTKEEADAVINDATVEVIEIEADGDMGDSRIDEAEVTVPAAVLEQLKRANKPVDFKTQRGRVSFPAASLAQFNADEGLVLDIGVEEEPSTAQASKVTAAGGAKRAVAKAAVEIDLKNLEGNVVADKASGKTLSIRVSIETDITVDAGYDAAVWYAPEDGDPEAQDGVELNDGLISWDATHFSPYLFGEIEKQDEDEVKEPGEDDEFDAATGVTPAELPAPAVTGNGTIRTYTIATEGKAAIYTITSGAHVHTVYLAATPAAGLQIRLSDLNDKLEVWSGDGIEWTDTAFKWTAVTKWA